MELNKLLRPKSIAVVGATDKPGFGLSTCTNLLKSGMKEHVYFVHPKRTEVLGKECYRCIADIPERIDMCVLIVNKKVVPQALEEAAECGCKAAVVYASGYGETGDKESENELRLLCQKLDMAVMGVNCAGFINNLDDIFAFGMLVPGESRKGNVAVISQSGKICLNMMQIPYMNFSYLISSGNSTCIRIEDYLEYLIQDRETKVIGLYMEGIKDPVKFKEVLKQAALARKPVVILKVGKTSKGSALAASHTGSLAGSDKAFDAIVKKFGVIRVDDIEELVQMCHLLSVLPMIPENIGLSAMCLSGGETGVCADTGTLLGLQYPNLAPETMDKLRALLPDYATPANPLDMSATLAHDGEKYAEVIQAIMEDPSIGMVLCGQTILPNHGPKDVIWPMSDGMVTAAGKKKKPVAVMSFFNSSRDERVREKLERAGVPILPATGCGFKLLKYLMDFVKYDPKEHILDLAVMENQKKEKVRTALSEHESKCELAAAGVPVPPEAIVGSLEELKEFTKSMTFPAVAKIASPDILHKSDVGGVKLNLMDACQVEKAYREIMENVKVKCPGAKIDGVLIQSMLPQGVEMIIGVNTDPQFGPMILCGLGGVFVEVFKDVSLYPAPLNKQEARDMIWSLKGSKLLNGYRGSKPCDVDALAEFIVKISEYAVAHKETLKELDINPLFVYPEGEGAALADALIVKEQ